MTTMPRLAAILVALILAAAWPATGGSVPPPAGAAGSEPIRGMTVSCQTWGWEWGTDEMVESMRELRGLGVNWIAIHPYAGIRADGTVAIRARRLEDHRWLTRPIAEAHRLGLKIMIKPHMAYWGSPFRWRGEIEFKTAEQWQRFFAGYEAWITRLAEVCKDADAFVVGTELDRTIGHERQWRRIIAAVRARFRGPLTYAANWTDYEQVPFWDALDVIGIQAYFPMADRPGPPEPEELDRAWAKLLARLAAFGRRHDRKIVLAELGYCRSPRAAMSPWEGREGGEGADETQRRCLAAAMRALDGDETVVGVFLWKWFARPTRRANFLLTTPPMRKLIAEHWKGD